MHKRPVGGKENAKGDDRREKRGRKAALFERCFQSADKGRRSVRAGVDGAGASGTDGAKEPLAKPDVSFIGAGG